MARGHDTAPHGSTPGNGASQTLLMAADAALAAGSVHEAVAATVEAIGRLAAMRGAAIYLVDPRLAAPILHVQGIEAAAAMEEVAAAALNAIKGGEQAAQPIHGEALAYVPLHARDLVLGVLVVAPQEDEVRPDPVSSTSPAVRRLAEVLDLVIDREASRQRIHRLNAYLTISSSLGRALDLAEALEIALYCSMEAVDAEAASVLLLDEEKEHLTFYSVEGPAQPVLQGASFSASEGIAGAVLQTLDAVVVDEAHADPRFYERIDTQSGFRTKNLIAVPLVAGEEPVGVLEVLNKAGGGAFSDEEKLLLVAIADQIAFAIRNARIFECLVDSYCNRRKGIYSCKGCHRPLGSWTPCMRYHDPTL